MNLSGGATLSSWLTSLCLLALFLLIAPLCQAAGLAEINARYSQPRGTKIGWQIHIPSPAPAAVIVLQTIPPGTVVKSCTPQQSSYDSATGTVKWLLTKVRPGTIKMRMELDRPIRKKGEIHGKIIFQDNVAQPTASKVMTLKSRTKAIEGC